MQMGLTLRTLIDLHKATQHDRWNHTAYLCSVVAQFSGNARNRNQVHFDNFHPYRKRRRGLSLDTPEGFQAAAEYFCGPSEN